MSTRTIPLSEALIEVSSGVGPAWTRYRVLGATRAGLALAKEPVGKAPERYKLVEPGTIFYNPMRILIGSIAMLDDGEEPGITSPDYVVVRTRPGVLHHRWFYHWLRSEQGAEMIRSLARGAVRERLLFKRLARGSITIPDWDSQVRAADKLAIIQKARAVAAAQLEAAKALPAAYLREVFESQEARKWPVRRLGDTGNITSGITLGRKLNSSATQQRPYLRVANVKDGYLDLSSVLTTPVTGEDIEKLTLQKGDLLLTEGGDPDKLGRGTVWNEEITGCLHQNHIFRVRFPATAVFPEFAAFQAGSSYGKRYFLAHAKRTTGIATINQRVLSAFPLLLPPLGVQIDVARGIASKLATCNRLLKLTDGNQKSVGALPSSIMQQAFGKQV